MDVVCLGELLIDMFPAELGRELTEVSAFRPKPGGAPANVAVAVARLGMRSAFIGKVGDDAFGHHLADTLAREGVEVRGMRFDREARTGMAFIAMPDENHYEILFYRHPGADMRLRADELDRALLQEARAFHFGAISLIQEPSRSATMEALQIARQAGALISFDVNYRPDLWSRAEAYERVMATLPYVDLLKINEVEVSILGGEILGDASSHENDRGRGGALRRGGAPYPPRPDRSKPDLSGRPRSPTGEGSWPDLDRVARALLACGPRLCVVTLGPEGSYFQVAGGGEHVPAFKVKTVDATGCGDGFVAGLICQLISGQDWRDCLTVARMRQVLRYASAVGALTSLTQGVIPALPTAEQVDVFLRREASNVKRQT